MEYEYFDTKTATTMNLPLDELPYTGLSKDMMFQLKDMFDDNELGKMFRAFITSVWGDGYDYSGLDNRYQESMLRSMVENTSRFASGYFKKKKNLKHQNGDNGNKPADTQHKKIRGLNEITEN